jgi:hypothetical protein
VKSCLQKNDDDDDDEYRQKGNIITDNNESKGPSGITLIFYTSINWKIWKKLIHFWTTMTYQN